MEDLCGVLVYIQNLGNKVGNVGSLGLLRCSCLYSCGSRHSKAGCQVQGMPGPGPIGAPTKGLIRENFPDLVSSVKFI